MFARLFNAKIFLAHSFMNRLQFMEININVNIMKTQLFIDGLRDH